MKLRKSYTDLEDCDGCGAVLGPCINWPWHYEHEDCRAIREPHKEVVYERQRMD